MCATTLGVYRKPSLRAKRKQPLAEGILSEGGLRFGEAGRPKSPSLPYVVQFSELLLRTSDQFVDLGANEGT